MLRITRTYSETIPAARVDATAFAEPWRDEPILPADPGPCAECVHCQRCASESLACLVFRSWVHAGGRGRKQLDPASREPSRATFDLIYSEPDL
jgi:hypothetical protein